MKRTFILLSLLLAVTGLAWADEQTPTAFAGIESASSSAAADSSYDESLLSGGGCQLPDLSGLSDEEAKALALESGFTVSQEVAAQVPACPVAFSCTSIGACVVGSPCTVSNIGNCCTQGGFVMCCTMGSIHVQTCPCACDPASPFCAFQCVSSSNVRWRCS